MKKILKKNALALILTLFYSFSLISINASANDDPYYVSKFQDGIPVYLRHEFKSSDGTSFKGTKNMIKLYDYKNSNHIKENGLKSKMFLYKNKRNDFYIKSKKGIYYIAFYGNYKKIKKIKITYTVSTENDYYNTDYLTLVK